MLNVTEAARRRLLLKLRRRQSADDVAMRFTRKNNGWELRPDHAGPDDTVFTHDGRTVLLLDARVALAMASMTLDVRRTTTGARLKLQRVASGNE